MKGLVKDQYCNLILAHRLIILSSGNMELVKFYSQYILYVVEYTN